MSRWADGLDTMATRGARERLLLHLVVGACREKVHVSYPRLDVAESRARVPSFYALDVARGVTGTIPDHRTFADVAARASQSSLAWPAPPDPAEAIDQQEHDLAVAAGAARCRARGTACAGRRSTCCG